MNFCVLKMNFILKGIQSDHIVDILSLIILKLLELCSRISHNLILRTQQ